MSITSSKLIFFAAICFYLSYATFASGWSVELGDFSLNKDAPPSNVWYTNQTNLSEPQKKQVWYAMSQSRGGSGYDYNLMAQLTVKYMQPYFPNYQWLILVQKDSLNVLGMNLPLHLLYGCTRYDGMTYYLYGKLVS